MIHASSLLTLVIALVLLGGLAGPATAQGTPTGTESVPANLTPPASAVLLFELGARGAQVYACEADPDDATAFAWTFKAPDAELLNGRGEVVGHHFDGPTWQGLDGSAVAAAVAERADAPDSTAIPWLLLEAPEHAGSGAFATITHIPRLDTVGGVAPTDGCDETHAGEEARVPYEATYAFYYPAASATPAAQAGLVTIHVFSCPADLSQATGEGQPDRAALLAGCTPLASAETAPTLLALPDGEPSDGTMTAPGVYQRDGLALGDYAIGCSGEMPAELGSLLVTDAGGAALQNPVLRLNQMTPHAESYYFYFLAEATPSALTCRGGDLRQGRACRCRVSRVGLDDLPRGAAILPEVASAGASVHWNHSKVLSNCIARAKTSTVTRVTAAPLISLEALIAETEGQATPVP